MVRIATRSLPVVTGPAKAAGLVVTKFNAEVRAVLEQPDCDAIFFWLDPYSDNYAE